MSKFWTYYGNIFMSLGKFPLYCKWPIIEKKSNQLVTLKTLLNLTQILDGLKKYQTNWSILAPSKSSTSTPFGKSTFDFANEAWQGIQLSLLKNSQRQNIPGQDTSVKSHKDNFTLVWINLIGSLILYPIRVLKIGIAKIYSDQQGIVCQWRLIGK